MKSFHIYIAPSGEVEAVKRGFCWPAAILGVWWALGKRYWFIGFAMVGAGFVLRAYLHDDSVAIAGPLVLGARTFVGIKANHWRRKQLRSRGYRFRSRVNAANARQALVLYRSGPRNQSARISTVDVAGKGAGIEERHLETLQYSGNA